MALALASCSGSSGRSTATTTGPTTTRAAASALPAVRHVFLIVLENKSYAETWGPSPGAPYLGTTLRNQGNLLTQYFATSHDSLGNYISMVSGQPAALKAGAQPIDFVLSNTATGEHTVYRSVFMGPAGYAGND